LEWDYKNRTVDLYIPGYIKEALHKYEHAAPTGPEHAPHTWNPPVYGTKTQHVEDENNSPALSATDVSKLQQLTGTLLYYTRAIDPTLIVSINVLASEQTKATADTADKVIKLLNYCTTHPETKIRYHASNMILYIHSDASYLSERESKIRSGGFFYMGSTADTANKLTNGSSLIISTVLKHLYKCQRRSSPSHNIGIIRASSAPHTIGNRQHHCHRIQQWHNKTKTHKSNGHAFSLGKRQSQTGSVQCVLGPRIPKLIQSQTGSVQCVLGPRIPKFSGLFHKTPFAGTSQKNT
jgi:hypothetical protein